MTAEQLEELLGKVTQGEWITDEHLHDAPYQTIKIGPRGNFRVAKVWQDDCARDYNPEQKANATLIALAPSLARRVIAAGKLVEANCDMEGAIRSFLAELRPNCPLVPKEIHEAIQASREALTAYLEARK